MFNLLWLIIQKEKLIPIKKKKKKTKKKKKKLLAY